MGLGEVRWGEVGLDEVGLLSLTVLLGWMSSMPADSDCLTELYL